MSIFDEASLRYDPRLHIYRAIFNHVYREDLDSVRPELGKFLYWAYNEHVPRLFKRKDREIKGLYTAFCARHGIYYSNRSNKSYMIPVYPHVDMYMFEPLENCNQFTASSVIRIAEQYAYEKRRYGDYEAAKGLRRRLLNDDYVRDMYDELEKAGKHLFLCLVWPSLRMNYHKSRKALLRASSSTVKIYVQDRTLAPWMANPDRLVSRLREHRVDVHLTETAECARRLYGRIDLSAVTEMVDPYNAVEKIKGYERELNTLQRSLDKLHFSYEDDENASVAPTEEKITMPVRRPVEQVQTVEAVTMETAVRPTRVSDSNLLDTRHEPVRSKSVEERFHDTIENYPYMVMTSWEKIGQKLDLVAPLAIKEAYESREPVGGDARIRPSGPYLCIDYVNEDGEKVRALALVIKERKNDEQ